MHRMLEAKEAALIDSARSSMLTKVTNLQAQYDTRHFSMCSGTFHTSHATNGQVPACVLSQYDTRYNSLQHAVEVIDKEATHAKNLLDEGEF